MIAIIDYGLGNIKSLQSALTSLQIPSQLTNDYDQIARSDAIILPGVGAFQDAMKTLRHLDLIQPLCEMATSGKPFLGICLGMQLLYEKGYENGVCDGLGLLKGTVRYIGDTVKVPHMGWNTLTHHKEHPLLTGIPNDAYVYFVHSYYVRPESENTLISSCTYGPNIPAIVQKGSMYGMQFHPEKSGKTGMKLLQNFGELIT